MPKKSTEDKKEPKETLEECAERFKKVSHIQKANRKGAIWAQDLVRTTSPEIQKYLNQGNQIRRVRDMQDLSILIDLQGTTQAYRERVAFIKINLTDINNNINKLLTVCTSWINLQPELSPLKEKEKKSMIQFVLEDLYDASADVQSLIANCETAIWTLKSAADSYVQQKEMIQMDYYTNKKRGEQGK